MRGKNRMNGNYTKPANIEKRKLHCEVSNNKHRVKVEGIKSHIVIILLNVNGLNSPTKSQTVRLG